MSYYTYVHRKSSNGQVFYVGKGKDRRAWAKNKRSDYWNKVVAKHGFFVEIVEHWETEEQAHRHECFLISMYRSIGVELANLTDGGDGTSGWKHSPETVFKIKESNKGKKRSPEACKNSRMARADWLERGIFEYWTPERREEARKKVSGENHPNFGKKFSDELRAKLSASHKGKINKASMRAVRCVENGAVFDCMKDAAQWLKEGGVKKATGSYIGAAANGKFPSAYGFRWELA